MQWTVKRFRHYWPTLPPFAHIFACIWGILADFAIFWLLLVFLPTFGCCEPRFVAFKHFWVLLIVFWPLLDALDCLPLLVVFGVVCPLLATSGPLHRFWSRLANIDGTGTTAVAHQPVTPHELPKKNTPKIITKYSPEWSGAASLKKNSKRLPPPHESFQQLTQK